MNIRRPLPYGYNDDLMAGRGDLQADAHRFLDSLFSGCTILDIGAGHGRSKERMVRNRVTTWDVDRRLAPFLDAAGGIAPLGPFDIATAFDVIEHVEHDWAFLNAMAARCSRAAFLSTPNWHVTRCNEAAGGSTHHWREYTEGELFALAKRIWPLDALTLFAFYKDADGGWWELPRVGLAEPLRRKHGLLWCASHRDRDRVLSEVGSRRDLRRTPA